MHCSMYVETVLKISNGRIIKIFFFLNQKQSIFDDFDGSIMDFPIIIIGKCFVKVVDSVGFCLQRWKQFSPIQRYYKCHPYFRHVPIIFITLN